MKCIGVQMIDWNVPSDWWKALVKRFVKVNASLQIRCWNEESNEIEQAARYGTPHVENNETCMDGVVSADFLDELLHSAEPEDQTIYHKMTKYFTIRVSNGKNVFESAHYGTELYIVTSPEEVAAFHEIMKPYTDSFSISIMDV